MQIPVNFEPRWYQTAFLRAMDAGAKLAVLCWSRRAGKDFTCFGYAVKKMVEQPMNVVLVFPTKKQGYDAFWTNVENDGFKTIEHIPKELIAAQSNSPDNMKITLINGSTFSLLGATDPEALRGANGKLYIFSEFVDIDSAAYDVIVPIVEVNGGQIIIQSTPKIDGISGGTFKIMFDSAVKDPQEYASLITAKEYLSDEQLERLERKAIEKNGNNFFFRQEFLCDWGQASQTSYYGQILKNMENDGAIGMYPVNPLYPVYTVRDMGVSDNLALGFWQYYPIEGVPTVTFVDYYESSGVSNEAVVNFIKSKPYNMAWHFFPHDGSVRDSDLIPRIEKHRELGLINSSLLRREPKEDGINRVITNLPRMRFHAPTTSGVIKKLYLYKRKYNPLTGDYMGPEHRTESHIADMIRYLFAAIEQEFNKETCEMYISQVSQDDYYESDVVTTSFYSPSQGSY